MVGGIIAGLIAFIIAAALTTEGAHFPDGQGIAGVIAALWVGYPFYKHGQIERYNLLCPVPKRYSLGWQQAFAKIREILARASYKMGNRWNVTTADTVGKHIHAILTFTDEEFAGYSGTRVENIRRNTERVRRQIDVDFQFKEDGDNSIVQMDFSIQIEGANPHAADFVVDDIKTAVERELGAGVAVGNPAEFTWEAPPWWLLIVTGILLLMLWSAANKAVFGS